MQYSADALRRLENNGRIFQKISGKWGKLTIDRFANNENTKKEKFKSKYWCPGTSNINAFTVSWSGENNYLVPPIYLIPRVIAHIKRNSSKGVLGLYRLGRMLLTGL